VALSDLDYVWAIYEKWTLGNFGYVYKRLASWFAFNKYTFTYGYDHIAAILIFNVREYASMVYIRHKSLFYWND